MRSAGGGWSSLDAHRLAEQPVGQGQAVPMTAPLEPNRVAVDRVGAAHVPAAPVLGADEEQHLIAGERQLRAARPPIVGVRVASPPSTTISQTPALPCASDGVRPAATSSSSSLANRQVPSSTPWSPVGSSVVPAGVEALPSGQSSPDGSLVPSCSSRSRSITGPCWVARASVTGSSAACREASCSGLACAEPAPGSRHHSRNSASSLPMAL